jgi:hypothetical protein
MRYKRYINILLVIGISAILLIIWINGLNWVYAKILAFVTNILLFVSENTSLSVEDRSGEVYFIVDTLIDGRKGSYPQKAGLIILPFVMMLTWQALLFINIHWRKALRSTIENLLIFILIQVIYLLILTGYYESDTDKFFFHLLIDSFYIFGLFLIVKDTIRYRLIKLPQRDGKDG